MAMVIFDWNGTLLDDAHATWGAANKVLCLHGAKPITFSEYRDTITVPVNQFYVLCGCTKELLQSNRAESVALFHREYEILAQKAPLRHGASDILQWLHTRGIELHILSNHLESSIQSHLARVDASHLFTQISANTDGQTSRDSRTKSERLASILKANNTPEEEVLIVGDSPEEAELGRAFGIRSALVYGGSYSDTRLQNAKPDFLLKSLAELRDCL